MYNGFDEEEGDDVSDMTPTGQRAGDVSRQMPLTAAVDGPNNCFSQQQTNGSKGMNPNSLPFSPTSFNFNGQPSSMDVQAQAMQMQMMQLEIMRLQTIQAQQYQNELLAQNQRQQQSQNRRPSFNPPATAGPLSNGFDLRAATLTAQMRRASQAEQLKSSHQANDDQVPMSAALGGKFGSRALSMGNITRSEDNDETPATPNQTTVISGGISLGNGNSSPSSSTTTTPSKCDTAVSWRRGGNNNSVLSGNRAVTNSSPSPSVKVTPPPGERYSPPPAKSRPQPLRFNIAASQPIAGAVAIDTDTSTADVADDGSSSSSSKSGGSGSSPTTPHSSSSSDMALSPREEAAKKLYEGLGIGRPLPVTPSVVSHRMASQPLRQPRGPPSGADELAPKNFATRIRRKAIGGLGALMAGRERRSVKNIQKITKSMKVVSTAKFSRAKAQLEEMRAIGKASQVLVDKAGIKPDAANGKQIVIALSSDRGLCGGIHSGLVKTVRRMFEEKPAGVELKIVPVGDKPRAGLQRTLAPNILISAMDIGRKPTVFQDAAFLAQNIIDSGYQFNSGVLLYNHFNSAVSYKIGTRTILTPAAVEGREELNAYDEVDSEVLQSYLEFDCCSFNVAELRVYFDTSNGAALPVELD
jgi:ATP synthase F1 gamma subunit